MDLETPSRPHLLVVAGYCWDELGRIEKDPDERVREVIGLILRKFQELGSARQVTMHELMQRKPTKRRIRN